MFELDSLVGTALWGTCSPANKRPVEVTRRYRPCYLVAGGRSGRVAQRDKQAELAMDLGCGTHEAGARRTSMVGG